ncbi:MAG: outer membrane beta-barrel protein [Janthinobacterium lividum]
MHSPRLALGGLLLALPFASYAQRTDPVPTPRFYVGLAAYSSYYQPLSGGANRSTRVPFQVTAGYQWRPRLALQAGLAYSGVSASYFYIGRTYPSTSLKGNYYDSNGRSTQRNTSASLLARYTLTRKPEHRLQFDVLGGFTWERNSYHDAGTRADSVQSSLVVSPYDDHNAVNRLLLTVGPSVRYRFGQHLEVFYNLLFDINLASSQYYQIQGVTSSSALGLRYRFGQP